MTQPTFSFIIVTYNNSGTIEPCLASIAAFTRAPYEIALVDNSPDGSTLDAVEAYKMQHPDQAIEAIRPGSNIGFGRACNLGAQHATGKYLFFLNPDTELMNDAATILARCLEEHPGTLAAGPAIFDQEGKVTRTCRNLPNLGRVILDATGLDAWWGSYTLTRFRHDEPRQVEQIIGAAMVLRRGDYESFRGMDEQFFVYFEEVDLCKRIQEAKGVIWFWPEAHVRHLAGISCEAGPARARMIFTLRESRRKYFRKYYGRAGSVLVEIVNRLEAIEKAAVLLALWIFRREPGYRVKARGFISVATGIAPRL